MKKFFLLAAVAATAMTANAQDWDAYYIIGSDVNGKVWSLEQEDCKFEAKGDGIYVWTGEFLGTGFKINDGTWNVEIGSKDDAELIVGEAYSYSAPKGGNIALEGCTGVKNPVVTINTAEETLLVEGEADGVIEWYITGTFNNWAIGEEGIVLTEVDEDIFEVKNVTLDEAGELKMSTTGWAEQWGSDSSAETPAEITPEALSVELQRVGGEGGGCPYTLEAGAYDVTWNYETLTLTLAPAGNDAVATIAGEEVEYVYYNLQGVKVANPVNGIFVKVAGKKATKVVVAE